MPKLRKSVPSRRTPSVSSVEDEPSGSVATRNAVRKNTPPLKTAQAAAKTGTASKAEEGAFGAGILEEAPAGGGVAVPGRQAATTDESPPSRRRRGKRRSRRSSKAEPRPAAEASEPSEAKDETSPETSATQTEATSERKKKSRRKRRPKAVAESQPPQDDDIDPAQAPAAADEPSTARPEATGTARAGRRPASTTAAKAADEKTADEKTADEKTEPSVRPPRTTRKKTATTSADLRAPTATPATPAADVRKMLINVSDPDECRIAIIRNGRLDELDIERATSASNVGNIYKGRVTNVESSIQAAFVDFGLPAHGFLHISDLHPQYFPDSKGEPEQVGRKTPRRLRPPIQTCLQRGSEVIVQIIKEGIGTKGPTLTTYISLPGRFLVMMPGMEQLGVSRKIEDEDQRKKAREILGQLSLPPDMGFIVRTAGVDRNKRDLQRDLHYLVRLWKQVAARIRSEPSPAELYKESDLVIRTIRDVYDSTLDEIVVDDEAVANRVREFLAVASPRSRDVVRVYDSNQPLFHKYGIESEIDKLHSKQVPLPCGGSLVIEQTEALVAIDVNSGRFRVPDNAEETAYRVNIEAVDEIARQLRLRDLGGLIICDMIDMMQDRHCRDIENRLRDALKSHKERAKLLRMSRFGIIEMTRQRQRPSFGKNAFRDCPRCTGTGRIKAAESVGLDVMRQIRMAANRENVARIDVVVAVDVANELLNRKRRHLTDLETRTNILIRIEGQLDFGVDQVALSCTDRRGRDLTNPLVGGGARPEAGRSADDGPRHRKKRARSRR